ncbi:sarcosine dehydrogenase, mitochondrial-like, partial [Chiloscyllium plagiosum]|uniref:sarcosine dehydrogenase, mitochondrial-like n=1 Tax=Chiloscyllium plagiosum TaxID=36176 RepID=UPI001CB84BC0
MNVGDLYGTLYVPTDGTMDPAGTCSTLARAATARGASVIENCPVTGIQVKIDHYGVRRLSGVQTDYGMIQTSCAINCAGERKQAAETVCQSLLGYRGIERN